MKIAIFAAGTGGHIFPALSIAEEFKKDDVIFFASNRDLEKQIFKKTGYKVIHLDIGGFRGKSIFEKLISFEITFRLLRNSFDCLPLVVPYIRCSLFSDKIFSDKKRPSCPVIPVIKIFR